MTTQETRFAVKLRNIEQIKPYERNPRINDGAVDAVAQSLQQFGFRTEVVTDGKSVLKQFDSSQPDAVLLDLNDSEKSNFNVCAAIRKHEAGEEKPVFIATDRNNDDAIEEAYRAGATDTLSRVAFESTMGTTAGNIVSELEQTLG